MRSVLEMLADADQVTGEEISRALGISRAAVWKQVEALRRDGWDIQSRGKLGYRLNAGDRLDPPLWQKALTTEQLGRGWVRYSRETGSTNAEVKRMALEGAPHGSLCLCETQTAGRGRLGRVWQSPPEVGLWQSVLLRPSLPPQQASLLTFCAALAMAEAVEENCGISAGIKWPNDLVHGGKKLCGILLEAAMEPDAIDYVVIGVGLNVRKGSVPPELAEQAACLEDFTAPPLRRELLVSYLLALEKAALQVEAHGWDGIREAYTRRSLTLGQPVRVSGAVNLTGVAEEIDAQGALWVRDGEGMRHRVIAGDVSVRGLMGYV